MNYPTRTEIEELSTDERLRLIGDIWDTLEPESLGLPEEHREILEERLAALERDPGSTVSREEMMRRVRSRQ